MVVRNLLGAPVRELAAAAARPADRITSLAQQLARGRPALFDAAAAKSSGMPVLGPDAASLAQYGPIGEYRILTARLAEREALLAPTADRKRAWLEVALRAWVDAVDNGIPGARNKAARTTERMLQFTTEPRRRRALTLVMDDLDGKVSASGARIPRPPPADRPHFDAGLARVERRLAKGPLVRRSDPVAREESDALTRLKRLQRDGADEARLLPLLERRFPPTSSEATPETQASWAELSARLSGWRGQGPTSLEDTAQFLGEEGFSELGSLGSARLFRKGELDVQLRPLDIDAGPAFELSLVQHPELRIPFVAEPGSGAPAVSFENKGWEFFDNGRDLSVQSAAVAYESGIGLRARPGGITEFRKVSNFGRVGESFQAYKAGLYKQDAMRRQIRAQLLELYAQGRLPERIEILVDGIDAASKTTNARKVASFIQEVYEEISRALPDPALGPHLREKFASFKGPTKQERLEIAAGKLAEAVVARRPEAELQGLRDGVQRVVSSLRSDGALADRIPVPVESAWKEGPVAAELQRELGAFGIPPSFEVKPLAGLDVELLRFERHRAKPGEIAIFDRSPLGNHAYAPFDSPEAEAEGARRLGAAIAHWDQAARDDGTLRIKLFMDPMSKEPGVDPLWRAKLAMGLRQGRADGMRDVQLRAQLEKAPDEVVKALDPVLGPERVPPGFNDLLIFENGEQIGRRFGDIVSESSGVNGWHVIETESRPDGRLAVLQTVFDELRRY